MAEFVEEEEEDDEVQVVDEDFDREDSPEIHSPVCISLHNVWFLCHDSKENHFFKNYSKVFLVEL